MLDQSFSYYNFDKIFLAENRKGNFNRTYLDGSYFAKHNEFKGVLIEKAQLKESLGDLTKEQLDSFTERLDDINREKEEIRLSLFRKIADDLHSKDFKFNLIYNPNKEVFSVRNNAAAYYAVKQLQRNIHKTFKVKQAQRNRIIKQLYGILSDGYPKILVKTDIRSFYESIPQDKLFETLNSNVLLTPFSKRLIRKIFHEFETIKDTSVIDTGKGVPRGIGISAYLSELFMRSIDNAINQIDDIIYYARYVDDIVVVFSPKTPSSKKDYLKIIKEIIYDYDIQLKDGSDGEQSKTDTFEFFNKETFNDEFDFLGYKFILENRKNVDPSGRENFSFLPRIELSTNKLKKYKKRIKLSIDRYNEFAKFNEKKERRLLIERLKFLTGNFHLKGNKKSIKSGIYYSNSMLRLNKKIKNNHSLKNLQRSLSQHINRLVVPPNIGINETELKLFLKRKFQFTDGFLDKENNFYSFSDLKLIKSIWENE